MVSKWQFKSLLDRISALSEEIERVSAKDHPYVAPQIVYRGLLGVLERDKRHLEAQSAEFRDPGADRYLSQSYNRIAIDIDRVACFFGLVDRVDSPRIPFEILRGLSWAAGGLVGFKKFRVVVRLDPAINYSILDAGKSFDNMGWERDWAKALSTTGSPGEDVLLLGMPSAYAHAILVNALAAHEIGHLLFFARLESVTEIIREIYRTILAKHRGRLEEYISELAIGDRKLDRRDMWARTADGVERYAYRTAVTWCIEVYADLVGTCLLGPAYIAAFDRIALGGVRTSESHPSNAFRRHLLMKDLRTRMPQILEDPCWEELRSEHEMEPARDPVQAFAEDVCQTAAPLLAGTLRELDSSPFNEDPAILERVVESMLDHIENLSPPSVALVDQRGWCGPKGFWCMFYAAWRFRLDSERFGSFVRRYDWGGKAAVGAEEALGNLLLQGLRAFELKIRWDLRLHNAGSPE